MQADDNSELNIESQQFDSQKFIVDFLQKNSIQELIKKNNTIQEEIKNFDQEIQNLVFENYSKFISSIDTVKTMKEDIYQVDGKIKILEQSMSRITSLSTTIDDALKIKRNEIQRLEIVDQDLHKLSSLCDFPKVLDNDIKQYQQMLEQNNVNHLQIFKDTVDYYQRCFLMIKKFREEPLVAQIYKDSIDKVEVIRNYLWNIQNNQRYQSQSQQQTNSLKGLQEVKQHISSKDLQNVTKKLIIITEDQESVLRNYLKIIKDKLIFESKDILEQLTEQSSSKKLIEDKFQQFLIESKYNVTFEELEKQNKVFFQEEVANQSKVDTSIINIMTKLSTQIFNQLKEEVQFLYVELDKYIGKNQKCLDSIDLTIKEIIMAVLIQISDKLNSIKITNIEINEIFKMIYNSLQSSILNAILVKKSLRTEIYDKFQENVELICRGQIMQNFSNLRVNFISFIIEIREKARDIQENYKSLTNQDLADIEQNLKKAIAELVTYMKSKLNTLIMMAILDQKSIIYNEDHYFKGYQMFVNLLHNQFIEFAQTIYSILCTKKDLMSQEYLNYISNAVASRSQLNKISSIFMDIMSKYKKSPDSSVFYIVVNQFLLIYENKFLYQIFDYLAIVNNQALSSISQSDQLFLQNYTQLKNAIDTQEVPKLITEIKVSQIKNLVNYCQYSSDSLLLLLDTYFSKDLLAKALSEPKDVSESIERVIELVKVILLQLGILFPDMKRGLSKKRSFIRFENNFNIEMEKMIVKKSHHILPTKEVNRNSVLINIFKNFLKTIVFRVRELPCINKFGYQLLQLDLYCLLQIIYEMVTADDENLIIGFYVVTMESAQEICIEQNLQKLDQNIIETIVGIKRTKLKI